MAAAAPAQSQPGGEQLSSQLRDFLSTYNSITEHCFAACVSDMRGRGVGIEPTTPEEVVCSERCLQKQLSIRQRTTARLQDHLMLRNETLQASQGRV